MGGGVPAEDLYTPPSPECTMDIVGFASIIAIFSFVLFVVLLPLAGFAFWVWMLIDCVQRRFKDDTDRLVWVLVIVLLSVVGAIIYYFAIKRGMMRGAGSGKR